jgi:hypothetical protein
MVVAAFPLAGKFSVCVPLVFAVSAWDRARNLLCSREHVVVVVRKVLEAHRRGSGCGVVIIITIIVM